MSRSRPASNPVSFLKAAKQYYVTRAGRRIDLGSDQGQAIKRLHEMGLGIQTSGNASSEAERLGGVFRQGVPVRYACIHTRRDSCPLGVLCRVLQVSRSGYYAWCRREPSATAQRRQEIVRAAQRSHGDSHGTYGYRRVHRDLIEDHKIACCRETVRHVMGDLGLCGRHKRRFVKTTDSNHAEPIATNRFQREGLTMSMSRKGDPWDNAMMESFFGSLKTEWIDTDHGAEEQPRMEVFKYIEMFYNPTRRHSALAYLSPAEYERRYEDGQPIPMDEAASSR